MRGRGDDVVLVVLEQDIPVVALKSAPGAQPGTVETLPPRSNAAREMGPKYPTAGAIFFDDCQEATAARVWVPK